MRYRISQIRLKPGEDHSELAGAIRKKLKKPNIEIEDIEIVKESVDARKKPDIRLVYTVDFSCRERLKLPAAHRDDYNAMFTKALMLSEKECVGMSSELHSEKPVEAFKEARKPAYSLRTRPVIAGFGPCGMFAALLLAEAGAAPIVVERGEPVDDRIKTVKRFLKEGILDTESNVQFGEGGAGTFSDGKLTTGVRDVRISKVLQEFVRAGADEEILYKNKPHIGTDKLRSIVKNIRTRIENLGGEVIFNARLDGVVMEDAADSRVLRAVVIAERRGMTRRIETDNLILATGHSARDTCAMLYDCGLDMEQKPFSIGVRIEHLQARIDEVQYGDPQLARVLGAADYKINHRCENGRGVYTFCMCPGGEVINSASEPQTVVTNGMSNSGRAGKYANSGLLVDVRTEDFASEHPLAGIEFQRKYEKLAWKNGKGSLPATNYASFYTDEDDCVRRSLPGFAADAIIEAMPHLGRKLSGFDSDDAVMKGVETRSSSPVRILRDETRQANIKGVYPAGEGSGYAGGIVSAAVDGIKTAERILNVIIS